MIGVRFLAWLLLRAFVTAVIALFLLSFIAMWLFPELTDPISDIGAATYLLWAAVYLIAIGIGALEGVLAWKRYKKDDEDNLPH